MSRLFLLLLLLAACSGPSTDPEPRPAADSSAARPPATAPRDPETADLHAWSGTLGGRVPVLLQFAVHDSVVRGSILYQRSKERKPILLLGHLEPEGYRLFEFAPDGSVTGILLGKMTGSSFDGTWHDPGSERALPFALAPSDSGMLVSAPRPVTGAAAGGSYAYSFGETGAAGGIDVTVAGDSARFDINCVTRGPAHNIADLQTGPLPLKGNSLIYADPATPGCRFRIRFYEGFLVIDYLESQYDCGFGHNATVEGIFLRTGDVSK
ncbi:hypothetical protein [Flaviaesturariibacter amylovorans]|uniref:Lipoprotein n=1 Tax=Flaviaesturariibacter amylovorans TaxID=1084520 RepID=A0ABP8HR59_9BACT